MAGSLPISFVKEYNVNLAHKEQDHPISFISPDFEVVNRNNITSGIVENEQIDTPRYPIKEVVNAYEVNRAYKEKVYKDTTGSSNIHVIDQKRVKSGVAEKTYLDEEYTKLPREVVIIKELDLKPSIVNQTSTTNSNENYPEIIKDNSSNNGSSILVYANNNFDPHTTTAAGIQLSNTEETFVTPDFQSTSDSHYRYDQIS